jgi:GT2 family glycosyltransferase
MSNNLDFDISIVIVNYNVKDFLFKCLQSVENSSNNLRVQTIVVDNNSHDGSVDFLIDKFSSVEFISLNDNLGFGKANNIGIEKTLGKYLLILNPDTILQEDTLEIMFEFMKKNPQTAISTCKVLNSDGSFQSACRRGFPTPFTSFSKLFGLQSLFPKSKIFGKYNMTFLPIDECYNVDAVIGAFMFCRTDIIKQIGGFDTDFFMYGEDIDLCYRTHKLGYFTSYYPATSIIHFKGESSKRSDLNLIKIFYSAMEIYVKKHYSRSTIFVLLLRIGIIVRTFLTYIFKYKRDFILIFIDFIFLNVFWLLGTYIIFGNFFKFPSYAYPTVFIVPPVVLFFSMIASGDYFESSGSIPKSFFAYSICFFILSTLTYFFPAYRFSRGSLLIMIALSMISSSIFRLILMVFDKIKGEKSEKKLIFVANHETAQNLINEFSTINPEKIHIAGYVIHNENELNKSEDNMLLGTVIHLKQIIEEYDVNDVIISDDTLSEKDIISIIENSSNFKTKFHVANKYEDFMVSKIINDITETNSSVPKIKLKLLRYRIFKRLIDIFISFVLLISIFPFYIFLNKDLKISYKSLFYVFIGSKSIIGIFNIGSNENKNYKEGVINLIKIGKINRNNIDTITKLNNYYIKNYSISLDFDIFLKKLIRK